MKKQTFVLQERSFDLGEINQIYPAAIIDAGDGQLSPISLEWWEDYSDKARLSHFAICIHLKENRYEIIQLAYPTREALDAGMAELAAQLV